MAKNKEVPKKQVTKKKRFNMGKYFRSVVSELKKVTWPSREELIHTTTVVLAFILIFSVIIGIIDLGLGALLELIT